jgi:hypothetical protein
MPAVAANERLVAKGKEFQLWSFLVQSRRRNPFGSRMVAGI